MFKTKQVAVIMSVYQSDRAEFLVQAIESVLSQRDIVDLYIYRDGPVGDDLQSILESYEMNDSVQCFYSENNLGLAFSLNILIDRVVNSKYEFIARMDSDDICRDRRFLKQVGFLSNNPDISVCGTFCHEFGASYALDTKCLPTDHQSLLNFSISRCPFIHPSVMFRSSIFKTGVRYPVDTALTEDMALWFQLLQLGFKFANLSEPLLDYRLTEDTVSRRKGGDKAMSEFIIRFKYMFILKKVSLSNIIKIFSRLLFHILPVSMLKLAYKVFR